MSEPRIEILYGDCREIMAGMGAESVHCVITSPPYWGLRAYGTDPQIWGGDSGCHHVWGDAERTAWANSVPGPNGRSKNTEAGHWKIKETGPYCQVCGAWRGELGLEPTPQLYVQHLVSVFREVWRVLRRDGTLWLNLGDSYASSPGQRKASDGHGPKQATNRGANLIGSRSVADLKRKDLIGIPWRVALALQEDGWYLRSDIIWSKSNPMPESVTDRPTRAHEYVFLLAKEARYYYDADAIREPSLPERTAGRNSSCVNDKIPATRKKSMKSGPLEGNHGTMGHDGNGMRYDRVYNNPLGRNRRSVWVIATHPYPEAHFATFPPALVEPCIRAGSSEYGCCSACGSPWRRVTSTEYVNPGNRTTNGPRSLERRHETAGFPVRLERVDTTTGWEPTCRCSTPSVRPATVLDPFAGSGTVGEVATKHGRSAVLIELNAEYCALIRKRLDGVQVTLPMEGTG